MNWFEVWHDIKCDVYVGNEGRQRAWYCGMCEKMAENEAVEMHSKG